jgi:hypothetical protein
MKEEAASAVVKASPAIAGAAMTLNEWVALATIVYVVLQVGLLLPKYWRLCRTGREDCNEQCQK